MNKIISIVSLASLVSLVSIEASAQESEYRYDDAMQLWHQTDNAAGLGLDNSRDRGYAEFTVVMQNSIWSTAAATIAGCRKVTSTTN